MTDYALTLLSQGTAPAGLTNGFLPPVSDGVVGYYEFDSDSFDGTNLVNLVDPDTPAILAGSGQVVAADGITLAGAGNYFNTQLPETADWTVLAVWKSVAPGAQPALPCIVGNYRSTGILAVGDAPASGNAIPGVTLRAGAFFSVSGANAYRFTPPSTLQLPDSTVFGCSMWRCASGTGLTARDFTRGVSGSQAQTEARVLNSADTLLIGANYSATWRGSLKLARLLIANRAFTDAEALTTYQFWQADVAALTTPITV